MTPKKRNSVFGVMMGKGGKPGDPQQSGDGLMSERAEESTASDSNADDLLNDATELGAPIFTMTDDDPDHLLDEPPPSPGHSETVRFMIHNYSNLPYKIGRGTYSPEAIVHGYRWKLEIYPGGRDQLKKEWLSVYLWICAPFPVGGIQTDIVLRLINQGGQPDRAFKFDPPPVYGKKGEDPGVVESWGDDELIKKAELLDAAMGFIQDDCIILEADIWVAQERLPEPSWDQTCCECY